MDEVGRLCNLSRSGLGMRLPRELREKAVYTFDIRVVWQAKVVPCQAQIVWANVDPKTDSCFCGARIQQMDKAEKVELLDNFFEIWKGKTASQMRLA